MKNVRKGLEKRKWEREKAENWYQNWFSTSPWLSTLLPSLLGPLVGLFLLISFGTWTFNHLTSFIKQQVDNIAAKPIQVYYHRLAMEDALMMAKLTYTSPPKPGKDIFVLQPNEANILFCLLSWCLCWKINELSPLHAELDSQWQVREWYIHNKGSKAGGPPLAAALSHDKPWPQDSLGHVTNITPT